MDLCIFVPYFTCFIVFINTISVGGEDEKSSRSTTVKENGLWCAHCGSPRWKTDDKDVKDALEQFLEVRGGIHYPYDAIDPNCHRSRNVTASTIHRRKCLSDYCYSVTFRDSKGVALTMRGCAEYYMAVGSLKRSYCKKLTQSLDVVECVCRGSDVCNSSAKNRLATSLAVLLVFFALYRIR